MSSENDVIQQENDIIQKETQSPRSNVKTFFMFIASILGLGIVSGFIVYIVGGEEDLQNVVDSIPNINRFRIEDPFLDLNGTYTWKNNGNGLQLTILNALDDYWYDFFNTAVAEWDTGTPDALTLTTEISQPDIECSPITGFLKVCNGDYGELDWEGINQIYKNSNGIIYASTAQMNEYYLTQSSSQALRQYTMCHEIGHGLGLPHTDEKFWNINQGNCLDYTTRPSSNQSPDSRNFETLALMYGTVNGNRTGTGINRALLSSGNIRRKKNVVIDHAQSDIQNKLPSWVLVAHNEIQRHLHSRIPLSEHEQSRLLERNEHFELHEFDIGNGHTMQVRQKLARRST